MKRVWYTHHLPLWTQKQIPLPEVDIPLDPEAHPLDPEADTPWAQRQTPPGPKGRHPPGPRGRHPQPRGRPPPLVETSTEAGGTHPTVMLSCCKFYSKTHEKVRHKFQNYTFMANKLFLFLSSASRKIPFYSGGYYKRDLSSQKVGV